jgi:hypothetical protein
MGNMHSNDSLQPKLEGITIFIRIVYFIDGDWDYIKVAQLPRTPKWGVLKFPKLQILTLVIL